MPHIKGDFSMHDLWKLYREIYKGSFSIEAPRWNIKDWKNWCRLVTEIGFDNTERMMNYVIDNWDKTKQKFHITGYPTVGVLWCYRHSFLDYMNEKAKVNERNSNKNRTEKLPNNSKKLFLSQ